MFGITKKNIVLAGTSVVILFASAGGSVLRDSNSLNMQIPDASEYSYTAEHTEKSDPYTTAVHSERVYDTAHETSNSITVFVNSTEKYHADEKYSYTKDLIETEIKVADIIDAPEENVYVSSSGKYHATADCSGMKHYAEMSLDAATVAGYSPCGRCFDTVQETTAETIMQENTDISENAVTVYVSSAGKYHTVSDCSGMKRYTEMSLSEAIEAEYAACKKCVS